MFAMVIAGDSAATIARALTADLVPTPALVSHRPSSDPSSGHWIASVVRQLIANPIYFGAFAYGCGGRKRMGWQETLALPDAAPSMIDGDGPFLVRDYMAQPVVSEAEWRRANELMSGRDGNPRKRTSKQFLLSGLVRCAHCASVVTVVDHTVGSYRYRYYRHQTSNRETRGCPNHDLSLRAETLEAHVERVVLETLSSSTLADEVLAELEVRLESYGSGEQAQLTDALERDHQGVQRHIRQTVLSLAELGVRPHVEAQARSVLRELDARATMLSQQVESIRRESHRWSRAIELLQQARHSREGLTTCYERASYVERKQMLRAVVDEILLDAVSQRVEIRLRPFAPLGDAPA